MQGTSTPFHHLEHDGAHAAEAVLHPGGAPRPHDVGELIVFTDGQARSADLRATTRYLAGLLSHPFQGVAPSRGYRRPGLSGLERYSVVGPPSDPRR